MESMSAGATPNTIALPFRVNATRPLSDTPRSSPIADELTAVCADGDLRFA